MHMVIFYKLITVIFQVQHTVSVRESIGATGGVRGKYLKTRRRSFSSSAPCLLLEEDKFTLGKDFKVRSYRAAMNLLAQ